jgi:hypothetical protein
LLTQADIVVTNPPFSLFREYVAQLIEHDKKFLIIGNQNVITYKEIFKLIKKINFGLELIMAEQNGLRFLTIMTFKLKQELKLLMVKNISVWEVFIGLPI